MVEIFVIFFHKEGKTLQVIALGGGPSNNNDVAAVTSTDEESRGVRRSNPMSLTQMCNLTPAPTIEDGPTPLSKESLQNVYNVLQKEQEEYWNNNPEKGHKVVKMKNLGYTFRNTKETGTVIDELIRLRSTVSEFSGLGLNRDTNVDKVIHFCKKNM